MYGKFFSSTFTGSMLGAGADVFAVWGYVIANTVQSQVELNPQLLAPLIGMSVAAAEQAIAFLCAPDPKSRSPLEEGRRLVREGQFAYRVPNSETYRAVRNEEERREYNRLKQSEHRLRQSNGVKAPVNDSQSQSTMSAQAVSRDRSSKQKQITPKANGGGKLQAAELLKRLRSLRSPQFPGSLVVNWAQGFTEGELRAVAAVSVERILNTRPENDGPLLAQFADVLREVPA
jgi:hypothetical protein